MENDLHKKHRDRVRKDFLINGFPEGVPEHKVLELLLFYSIPRKDTNETAHMLLNRFGSIANILEADPKELMKISGIGENSVTLFKLIGYMTRYYESQKLLLKNQGRFENIDEVFDFILKKHYGLTKEVFAVSSFNSKGQFLSFDIINKGDVSSVGFSSREVVETVIKRNASGVVLSHNHPGGNAVPSTEDIIITEKLANILKEMGVVLLDHIITDDNDGISMRATASFGYIFK